MSNFYDFLKEAGEYESIEKSLKNKGKTAVYGCVDGAKAHLIQALSKEYSHRLVIVSQENYAKRLAEEYRNFTENVFYYPPKDFLFFSADIHGNLLAGERMQVLAHLLEEKEGTIVTTIDACLDPLLPLEKIRENIWEVSEGDEVNLKRLSEKLVYMGYERTGQITGQGQFCIRGGIIDIFSLTEANPVRIELWDTEVDSMRYFDVESQRSVSDHLESVIIYPATEIVLDENSLWDGIHKLEKECKTYEKALRKQMKTEESYRIVSTIGALIEELKTGMFAGGIDSYIRYFSKETVSFLDYFSKDTCVILDESIRIFEKLHAVEKEFTESMKNRLEKGYILPQQANLLAGEKDFTYKLGSYPYLLLSGLEQKDTSIPIEDGYTLLSRNVSSYQEHMAELAHDLKNYCAKNYRIIMLTPSPTKGERLAKELNLTYQLPAFYSHDSSIDADPGRILIIYGSLRKGFEYPQLRTIVITEEDMFGHRKHKRKKKHTEQGTGKIRQFNDLSIGDYVIHENHGIGVYCGVEQIEVQGMTKDYLKLEYGDGGKLYVPVTQLDLIQKYAKKEGKQPKLNDLGSKEWSQTKSKVKKSVQNIAKELVSLYAARQDKKGFSFSDDSIWQKEFEELFPYEETQDQLTAIEAVKEDMESNKIMDRLICGDVGFGKTEVAIRAAFKAVQDSKQVVYLVPTTILAQQHYNTFVQRMAEYPVRIELLSRFRTPKQVKNTLEDLKKGLVDIVIGTHRVLSKDVIFKSLGLLIVDEEQRFGVTHKERIKHLKENVDVLTLTATPIPRTLHMSLIGIRDMSVLEEAPLDRVPIQTYVMEHDEEMIREAINRELARDGQVYYVHNRVQNIDEVANKIQSLVPDANVAFAHGKMSERTLEKIMLDFINGEIDVLVSTTIIETGLDISNVNTIIIQDSDRFGLSQLYQLRGRVGRSTRTSYAFLTYTRGKILKEVAEKRLSAIRQFTELGSGVKIAMQDLEIRGAGNILGAEQHGHMEAVGYDLYCKMLNQAVTSLKEHKESIDFETVIDMALDVYLPSSYITDENQKLNMYKKIACIETEKDLEDLQDELIDRYGNPPVSTQYLLQIALLKSEAHQIYVTEVIAKPKKISLTMNEKAPVNLEGLNALLTLYRGRVQVVPGKTPKFVYTPTKNTSLGEGELITITKQLCADFKKYLLIKE